MAKAGRYYVQLDVNWYDEWGHTVSTDAALLWVLALAACKRMHKEGSLTLSQLRRVAPVDMTDERFAAAVEELGASNLAPIDVDPIAPSRPDVGSGSGGESGQIAPSRPDDRGIILRGWRGWNGAQSDTSSAQESGAYGNHLRWHVNGEKSSPDCSFCSQDEEIAPDIAPSRPDIGGESGTGSLRVEKSRVDISCVNSTPASFEDDFTACWAHYPRKYARKAAFKAYVAQRRKGISADRLLDATKRFATAMRLEGREDQHVMHGSTFFGPSDRWVDYDEDPKPEPSAVVAAGAAPLGLEDYRDQMGEEIVLSDMRSGDRGAA